MNETRCLPRMFLFDRSSSLSPSPVTELVPLRNTIQFAARPIQSRFTVRLVTMLITHATRSIARYMLRRRLSGWLAGWVSVTAGIVSKRLNLSYNFFENYTVQSGTHDFLLTFHSNHRPIAHRFRDKRRYLSKIANFPHPPCILHLCWRGCSWN